MDIISIAQQARPNPRGQMELLRAQFTALSNCVKMMPSSWSRLPKSSGLVSVACFPSEVLISFLKPIFAQGSPPGQITIGRRFYVLALVTLYPLEALRDSI